MKITKLQDIDQQILGFLKEPKSANRGFQLLMDQYQEKLYWLIRRMVLNHEDANDVLQNTFIKVFKNIQKFKNDSKLYTWLYRIATNETFTYLQKQKKLGYSELSEGQFSQAADEYFEPSEIQKKLIAAIAKLPEKQKAVFNLRYFDELSYKDISEILNTSEGALKASYHHAVKKIESFIHEKEQ